MTFAWPVWLILILPALLALWLRPLPTRGLTILRATILVLLLLAMAGMAVRLPSRSGVVVLVADRSLSMPAGSQSQQVEAADLLHRAMGSRDELAVVSFGQRTSVEQPPQRAKFPGFTADVGNEASNLAEGVDRAVSLIPRDSPGRILVLSDGFATGGDVATAAARAASSGIAIDYRAMQRSGAGDLAIDRIDSPPSVAEAEAFMISAWVNSPKPQEISYELVCGGKILAEGKREVPAGRSRLVFRDKAGDAGARAYTLWVRSSGSEKDDPVLENNTGRFIVGVRGNKPLLWVGPPNSALPQLLSAGGLKIQRAAAGEFHWSLTEFGGLTGVVVEDTPASQIGTPGMETLAQWISQAGGGLLMTGGRNAYGTGGYFKSPLEPVLPVSMELRREHRKLSLAMVVALDRSGSMGVMTPSGRPKMDLADLATVEVLKQLSGSDQFGCLAVDSIAHEIVPLSNISVAKAMEPQILKIDAGGGGIFIYEALEHSAAMIASASAGTRHIILFADAADSEEPGDYVNLVAKCVQAGITISVIGMGTERDCDANLLKDIARRGGGTCSFTNDVTELPRLFAQDTFLVSRSAFIDEATDVRTTPGMVMLSPQPWSDMPQVGGYNLCYLRPTANLAAVTVDDYKAPLVSSWQAGVGRVLCYTGEADGKFTGPIAGWPQTGEFFASLARWISAQDQGLGPDMLLTQDLRGGTCLVQLHLDSERQSTPFSALPQLTVLRGKEGEKPEAERLPLSWVSADVLSAEVPLYGGQTLLASLDLPGVGHATLPPTCLPYSAEYALRPEGEGLKTLQRMARATGGAERVNLGNIWADLPRVPRMVPLAPWLLLAAMIFLLGEILQRRTGLFSLGVPKSLRRAVAEPAPVKAVGRAKVATRKPSPVAYPASSPAPSATKPTAPAPGKSATPAPSKPAEPAPAAQEAMGDALSQARKPRRPADAALGRLQTTGYGLQVLNESLRLAVYLKASALVRDRAAQLHGR